MNLPLLFRVALGLLGVSLLLFLTGFSSSHWFVYDDGRLQFTYGLWAICFPTDQGCVSMDSYLPTTSGHTYVGRVCGIAELVGTIVSVVLLVLFAFKSAREPWAKTAYSMAFFAGIIGFLGAVIFIGSEKATDTSGYANVSWSGILVIFAAFMQIGAGVCIFLPVRRGQLQYEEP